MESEIFSNPSLGRGDNAGSIDTLDFYTTTSMGYDVATTTTSNMTSVRGDRWRECVTWLPVMPGSYFQLTNLMLFLAFMASGNSTTAAIYIHISCAVGFLSFAVWGIIDVCGGDIASWAFVLTIVNIVQASISIKRHKQIEIILANEGINNIYRSMFAPFRVSTVSFTSLMTCKGSVISVMRKGDKYAIAKQTEEDRLSLLISGRMRIDSNGNFLQYILPEYFIDSPEWDASTRVKSTKSVYKVTITADSDCMFITWKRKPLTSLLSGQTELKSAFDSLIGSDIIRKLYSLNNRLINDNGFRYDIRLPCVISLSQDLERKNSDKEIKNNCPRDDVKDNDKEATQADHIKGPKSSVEQCLEIGC